jgi:hypothetical protein
MLKSLRPYEASLTSCKASLGRRRREASKFWEDVERSQQDLDGHVGGEIIEILLIRKLKLKS